MSDDPLEAIKDLQKLHQDDLALLRSLVEAPDTVTLTRAQYDALMEAAEAHERIVQHDPRTPGLHYPSMEALLESAIGHSKQALAALRAAGIQTEEP